MIHGHGDDIYSQMVQIRSNFSSNVFEQGTNNWLCEFVVENVQLFKSYPEPNAASFVEILAEKNAIASEMFCATHGATDAIYLIAQAFSKSSTAIVIPTFSEYEDACKINKHDLHFVAELDEKLVQDFDTIWLCNPNNPTGKTWGHEQLLQIIDENRETIFVIDQTYRYFTQKMTISYLEAVERPNVILIDSFTKRFALPDLRLGYFVANAELVDKIQMYKQPWAVSQLAIEMGKYVLENKPYPLNLNALRAETRRLQRGLKQIEGLKVCATDTHFFLCELEVGNAEDLKKYLLQNHKILIRNASNFRGLNSSYFRIATQQKEENNCLVAGMKSYCKSRKEC